MAQDHMVLMAAAATMVGLLEAVGEEAEGPREG